MIKFRNFTLAFVSLCLMAFATTGLSQFGNSSTYTIHGEIENYETHLPVRLNRYNPVDQSQTMVAQVEVGEKGEYFLEFEFTEPDLYRLELPGRQRVMLAIDAGQVRIKIDAEGKRGGYIHLAGSKDSKRLMGYNDFRVQSNAKLVSPTYKAMREAKNAGNVEAEVDAVEAYVVASKQHRKELLDYIEENIGTSIALYGTMLRWTGDDEVSRLDRLVEEFADVYPNLNATKAMQEKVARYKSVAVGAKAPGLSALTPTGEVLSLADVNAEYILIDFWASWCGPCISQFPDLQKVYQDFKNKGLEVFSVSIDSKADKWKAAIDKYNLDWLHISDLKAWQSELATDYNVTFVPFNLIVDKDGTIVAKNMHSKTLYAKLTELFEAK